MPRIAAQFSAPLRQQPPFSCASTLRAERHADGFTLSPQVSCWLKADYWPLAAADTDNIFAGIEFAASPRFSLRLFAAITP